MTNATKTDFKAWLALGIVCFFWGTTFLGIRVGVQTVPPFLLSGARQLSAGLIVCLFCMLRGAKMPEWRYILPAAISGVITISIGNGVVTWAEKYVNSGLAALLCSLTPFWMIAIHKWTNKESSINGKVILGLLLGLGGMVLIFYDNLKDFVNPLYTLGIISIMIANITWSLGSVYTKTKKFPFDTLLVAGIQMLAAGLVLSCISVGFEDILAYKPEMNGILSFLYLTIFGSVVAYVAYVYALEKLPTAIVSIYAYINPIVAVLLGWLILNEKMNLTIGIAFAVTLAGVYFVNAGSKR